MGIIKLHLHLNDLQDLRRSRYQRLRQAYQQDRRLPKLDMVVHKVSSPQDLTLLSSLDFHLKEYRPSDLAPPPKVLGYLLDFSNRRTVELGRF